MPLMDHTPIKIRKPTPADLSSWAKMRSLLWPSVCEPDHRKDIQVQQNKNGFVAFVAEAEDKSLVGFCEGSIRPHANGCKSSPVPFAEGCWVAERFRKIGVGQQLMAALEDWAIDAGFSEIGSDCEVGNSLSQEFHRHIGFLETERVVYFRKVLKSE